MKSPRYGHERAVASARTVERGSEEGFEAVREGQRSQQSAVVENRRKFRAALPSKVEELERGLSREKSLDDHLVFFRLAGARRINEPAAWPDDARRTLEQGELAFGEGSEIALVPPPFDVRIAANGAEP